MSRDWNPSVVVIDGRNLLFRAADAHNTLTTTVDDAVVSTGGVYGFLNVMSKLRRRYGAMCVVAWEGKNNFRYKLYPAYKAKHVAPTEQHEEFRKDLAAQEALLSEILTLLGVPQFAPTRGEADDAIGTIAVSLASHNRVGLFSNDSDLRQLVTHDVRCIVPGPKGADVIWGTSEVRERYGVEPSELADFKAISGDSSDNIPGVPGIGPKTAAKLIQENGGALDIARMALAGSLFGATKRQTELIVKHATDLVLYLRLTSIDTRMPLKRYPEARDKMEARLAIARLKMRSLLEAGPFNDLIRAGTPAYGGDDDGAT